MTEIFVKVKNATATAERTDILTAGMVGVPVHFTFDEAWDGQIPLRQMGVQVTRLAAEPYRQFDFFSGVSPVQYERKLRLDEAVDALRDKFGEDIIRRAKFAQNPEAHMAGGLSKARRTGVTKPLPPEF